MSPDDRIHAALESLCLSDNLYCAGLPSYPRNFPRDSFTYGLIANDVEGLEKQIAYCAQLQGKKQDPLTGEEPGKIHHEYPGKKYRGKVTTYNSCDSTALFVLAICACVKKSGKRDVLKTFHPATQEAVTYIVEHVKNGIFYEDPKYADASDFALRVTYWKDSVINSYDEVAHYPMVYTLAQFQNALALNQAGKMLKDQTLVDQSLEMYVKGIEALWRDNHFVTALESNGTVVDPSSTDSLHSLAFIPPDLISRDRVLAVEKYCDALETSAGYRTGIPQTGLSDCYHTNYVWSHEQAILHCGASYHNLTHARDISKRILLFCQDSFPELIDAQSMEPAGNPLQLWTVGAFVYFTKFSRGQIENPFVSF